MTPRYSMTSTRRTSAKKVRVIVRHAGSGKSRSFTVDGLSVLEASGICEHAIQQEIMRRVASAGAENEVAGDAA